MQLYVCVACPIIRKSEHITRCFFKNYSIMRVKTGMYITNFSLVRTESLNYFKETYIE